MDDLEKKAREEVERHQAFSNWVVNWIVDPLVITTLLTGFTWMIVNSSDSRKLQKPQIVDVREELRYQPIQPVQPANYQVETQNQEYFPERPQI